MLSSFLPPLTRIDGVPPSDETAAAAAPRRPPREKEEKEGETLAASTPTVAIPATPYKGQDWSFSFWGLQMTFCGVPVRTISMGSWGHLIAQKPISALFSAHLGAFRLVGVARPTPLPRILQQNLAYKRLVDPLPGRPQCCRCCNLF